MTTPSFVAPKDRFDRSSGTPLPVIMVGSLAYVLILVFVTNRYIATPFAYLGFIDRPTRTLDIVAWLLVSAGLGLLPVRRWIYPSHAAFAFLIATIALPVVTIPVFWGRLDPWPLLLLQLTTFAAFGALRLLLCGNREPWRGVLLTPHLFWTALTLATVAAIGYLFVSTGISPGLLSFAEVYTQREEFSGSITRVGAYLIGWVGAGLLPVLLATGLYRRNAAIISSALAAVVALYSLTGYKSYLVGVALMIAAYVVTAPHRRGGHWWLTTFGVVITAAAVIDQIRGGYAFSTLLVRRALATAGLNTANFIDFFDANQRYGLRHSVLSFLGPPPYDISPARLIGSKYYGSSELAANVNFVGDGYANFGIPGVLFMMLVLGVFLLAYDKATMHLPLQVSAPAMTLFLIAASNTAVLTVLLTHGGLVLLCLMLTMPAPREAGGGQPVERVVARGRHSKRRIVLRTSATRTK